MVHNLALLIYKLHAVLMYGMWLYITIRFIAPYIFINECSDAFLTYVVYTFMQSFPKTFTIKEISRFFNVSKHPKHEMTHAWRNQYQCRFCYDFLQEYQIVIDTFDDFISFTI